MYWTIGPTKLNSTAKMLGTWMTKQPLALTTHILNQHIPQWLGEGRPVSNTHSRQVFCARRRGVGRPLN
jgi:hypothetical protein